MTSSFVYWLSLRGYSSIHLPYHPSAVSGDIETAFCFATLWILRPRRRKASDDCCESSPMDCRSVHDQPHSRRPNCNLSRRCWWVVRTKCNGIAHETRSTGCWAVTRFPFYSSKRMSQSINHIRSPDIVYISYALLWNQTCQSFAPLTANCRKPLLQQWVSLSFFPYLFFTPLQALWIHMVSS